jgi:hypothetical protein
LPAATRRRQSIIAESDAIRDALAPRHRGHDIPGRRDVAQKLTPARNARDEMKKSMAAPNGAALPCALRRYNRT